MYYACVSQFIMQSLMHSWQEQLLHLCIKQLENKYLPLPAKVTFAYSTISNSSNTWALLSYMTHTTISALQLGHDHWLHSSLTWILIWVKPLIEWSKYSNCTVNTSHTVSQVSLVPVFCNSIASWSLVLAKLTSSPGTFITENGTVYKILMTALLESIDLTKLQFAMHVIYERNDFQLLL